MPKGYAEGPAAEEAERLAEEAERGVRADERPVQERVAVYGATPDNPEPHFLGWADEVDTDTLFERGEAWGLNYVRRTES